MPNLSLHQHHCGAICRAGRRSLHLSIKTPSSLLSAPALHFFHYSYRLLWPHSTDNLSPSTIPCRMTIWSTEACAQPGPPLTSSLLPTAPQAPSLLLHPLLTWSRSPLPSSHCCNPSHYRYIILPLLPLLCAWPDWSSSRKFSMNRLIDRISFFSLWSSIIPLLPPLSPASSPLIPHPCLHILCNAASTSESRLP